MVKVLEMEIKKLMKTVLEMRKGQERQKCRVKLMTAGVRTHPEEKEFLHQEVMRLDDLTKKIELADQIIEMFKDDEPCDCPKCKLETTACRCPACRAS